MTRLAAAALLALLLAVAPTAARGLTPKGQVEGLSRLGSDPSSDGAVAFQLTRARAKPANAFFYAKHEPELRYRFRADGPVDVRVDVVKGKAGEVVRSWVERDAAPGDRHERAWNGLNDKGNVVPDGNYSFRVGPAGEDTHRADTIAFHQHRFPIPGSHSYREGEGEFGAARPGRVHQGKDVWAPCGARLLAARGGRVARAGFDPRLYGHFVVIDGRGTKTDLFYVHLAGPPSAGNGDRVRSGERIGRVGRSGNAQSVGCMLHLEVWPQGFRKGSPVDPEPMLRAWDTWS